MVVQRWGRTYQRADASRAEKLIGAVILALLAALVTAFVVNARSDAPALFALEAEGGADVAAGDEPISPFPKVEGLAWSVPDNVAHYTPANLWEKINGRADLYLGFNLRRMTFGTYRAEREPDLMIDVYWFELADSGNAFNVYQAEYGGHVEPLELGRAGYRAGGSIFFCKAEYYVRLEAPADEAVYRKAGAAIAQALADVIEDDGRPLWPESSRRTLLEHQQDPPAPGALLPRPAPDDLDHGNDE